jgi:valyl-tRNA synthetase
VLLMTEGKAIAPPGTVSPHMVDRWIVSRLGHALTATDQGFADYRFDNASAALYEFTWHEFCDWYLELAKPVLQSEDEAAAATTRRTLLTVLEALLRALHPIMPFITEEIWQRVPKHAGVSASIVVAPYPDAERDARRDEAVERDMQVLQAVIVAARAIRSERDIHPRLALPLHLRTDDARVRTLLAREQIAITSLCNAQVVVEALKGTESSSSSATGVAEGVTLVVPLEGLIDPGKEKERLARQLQKLDKDAAALEKKLGNEGFIARAPADVVQKDRERLSELGKAREQLAAALAKLG